MRSNILRFRSSTVIVDFPPEVSSEPLTVIYSPTTDDIQQKYNEHALKVRQTFDAKGNAVAPEWTPVRRMAEDLVITIKQWDMFEDDGSPTPITVESLMKFDAYILNRISEAIAEHMYPPSKSSGS